MVSTISAEPSLESCAVCIPAWYPLMVVAGLFVPNTEWQWRLPCFLQVFGPLVVLTIVILSPESPRWLASKGRVEQARAILVKHHANGKEDDELVEYEFREIVSTLEQESLKNKSRYVSPPQWVETHPQVDFFKILEIERGYGLLSCWVSDPIGSEMVSSDSKPNSSSSH
jgi:MFS family permease